MNAFTPEYISVFYFLLTHNENVSSL